MRDRGADDERLMAKAKKRMPSMPIKVDLADFNDTWFLALRDAQKGRLSTLVKLLRSEREISSEVRGLIADLLEGKIKKPRGIQSRLSYYDQREIRFAVRAASRYAEKITAASIKKKAALLPCSEAQALKLMRWNNSLKKSIIEQLAKSYNVSESTIRDVVAKRKTFTEK